VLKAHERLQGILEQMPTAIVILDPSVAACSTPIARQRACLATACPHQRPSETGAVPACVGRHAQRQVGTPI
jgi:hypothetical protein